MAEFNKGYYTPMDRDFYVGQASGAGQAKPTIEEPIITIGELGQTVVEQDPAGKFKNMVQGVQAALKAGSKNIQLILTTPHVRGLGGRPKGFGKEIREAMKDVFAANDATLSSIEMPNTMTNLSGFDGQQGVFSESVRKRDMNEVKEAIRFASDIGQGGGIDVISWEFQRPVSDIAKKEEGFYAEEEEVVQIVDKETGRINASRKNQIRLHVPYDPETGKEIDEVDPKTGMPVVKEWRWENFEKIAQKKGTSPEEEFIKIQLDGQIKTAMGWAGHYSGIAEERTRKINELQKASDEELRREGISPEKRDETIKRLERDRNYERQLAAGQLQQAREYEQKRDQMVPVARYAKHKAMQSYAELGIDAMDETNNNPKVKHPLHVGPELGWPHSYGGHPKEFVELVHGARKKMVQLLTNKYMTDAEGKIMKDETGKPLVNHNYRPDINRKQAEQEANQHIRGMLDTGHMGMWIEHYKPNLRWRDRVKQFNKWFMKQIDYISEQDVIGGIQAVDSAGIGHGHLPAGEGIFPVVDAVKKLKQKGFAGYIVSEGHEEEKFGEGRILLNTWKAFNSPIESKYGPGIPSGKQFNDIHQGYFGRQRPPMQMFGSYTPPFSEYKPWSEIPFE